MASLYKKFGEKIRRIRKERHLTQEYLAEKIQRDPRTVVAIETGRRNPTLLTIYKIAAALKISMRDLF